MIMRSLASKCIFLLLLYYFLTLGRCSWGKKNSNLLVLGYFGAFSGRPVLNCFCTVLLYLEYTCPVWHSSLIHGSVEGAGVSAEEGTFRLSLWRWKYCLPWRWIRSRFNHCFASKHWVTTTATLTAFLETERHSWGVRSRTALSITWEVWLQHCW